MAQITMMCTMTSIKRSRDSTKLTSERAVKALKTRPMLSPQDHLISVSNGENIQSSELVSFFHKYSDTEIEAYGLNVTRAVRSRNLDKLKTLHREGQTLQCSNRFGESILHMACRQGNFEMVQYMINEGNVSVRIKDDSGRTPLHDAFWSASPNFELVDFLIEKCPCLLFISDVRGHSPLHYVRMEHGSLWVSFLEKRLKIILKGKEDIAKFSTKGQ